MPIQRQHVALVAKYSTKYSIRGGVGLVFTLLALVFGLMVANALISPVEIWQAEIQTRSNDNVTKEEAQELILNELVGNARPAVDWILGSSSIEDIEDRTERRAAKADIKAWTNHLLDEKPAMLSAIMLILLWGWPFIMACGAFDMFSSDIASRGLRYQLLRADRGSIFWGRFLGQFATFVIVLTLLMATVTIYMGIKLPVYGWGPLLSWAGFGLVAMVIVSIPYLALCAWISACFGSSMASLAVASTLIGGVPLITMIARNIYEPAEDLIYLLPWGIQHHIFHPDLSHMLGTVAGCLGYGALFAYLGYRKLNKRDL